MIFPFSLERKGVFISEAQCCAKAKFSACLKVPQFLLKVPRSYTKLRKVTENG